MDFPWFAYAFSLLRSDYVGRCFFDHAKAFAFQLVNDGSFTGARRARDDEPLHIIFRPD
jgi:hypothetical protein